MKYTMKNKKNMSSKDGNKEQNTVHITDEGKSMEEIIQDVIDIHNGTYDDGIEETFIEMKCKKCGFEEGAPDWLMAESNEDAITLNQRNTMNKMICSRCNGIMIKK
jgi:predicted Zn-ribbon and HTH transcriptional regulator